jgi:hypothetical protein
MQSAPKRRGAPASFLENLVTILKDEDPAVVGWIESGEGFQIRNMTAFRDVLQKYYSHQNFSSFQVSQEALLSY